MRGRARGNQRRIIVLAHQIEAMARQKKLRDVDHYLRGETPKAAERGAADVLAMFRRLFSKQGAAAPQPE